MAWIRLHIYTVTLAGVAVLILIGGWYVADHAPVSPKTPSIIAWQGSNTSPVSPANTLNPQQIVHEVIASNQYPQTAVNFVPPGPAAAGQDVQTNGGDSSDYLSVLQQLVKASGSGSATVQTSSSAEQTIAQAYQFIPQGLVASNLGPKKMSASQQALYDYGNEIGGIVQSFERENPNQPQVLKDQAEDRSDPEKASALVALGAHMIGVGQEMQKKTDVPAQAASLHTNLANSYIDLGTKLQAVAQAHSDADFIQAIKTYDSSAQEFTQNYAALATYLALAGVTFASTDPGSEFSFSSSSGF